MHPLEKVHFISGLPRAGSTLLSAILRQNPRFCAGMTGPVGSLCSAVLPQMSGPAEFASFFSDEKRQRILRALFASYYADSVDRPVIFDTNRRWTTRLALIRDLFPAARVICCVRDIGWIIDSLERAIQRHPTQVSRIVSDKTGKTVYARVEQYMEPEHGIIGFAWSALREAWFSELADRLILIPYEKLASSPQTVISDLYGLLGEPHFPHDFENLDYQEDTYDQGMGTPGLHTVRRRVALEPRRPAIPPDLFHKYDDSSFWKTPKLNVRGVTIL
jgi:sulfotransferase